HAGQPAALVQPVVRVAVAVGRRHHRAVDPHLQDLGDRVAAQADTGERAAAAGIAAVVLPPPVPAGGGDAVADARPVPGADPGRGGSPAAALVAAGADGALTGAGEAAAADLE